MLCGISSFNNVDRRWGFSSKQGIDVPKTVVRSKLNGLACVWLTVHEEIGERVGVNSNTTAAAATIAVVVVVVLHAPRVMDINPTTAFSWEAASLMLALSSPLFIVYILVTSCCPPYESSSVFGWGMGHPRDRYVYGMCIYIIYYHVDSKYKMGAVVLGRATTAWTGPGGRSWFKTAAQILWA